MTAATHALTNPPPKREAVDTRTMEARLLDALDRAGQPYSGALKFGELIRYGRKDACWLIAHQLHSGHISAVFGDWREGSRHEFRSWLNGDGRPVEGIDAAAIQREIDQRQNEAEAKARRRAGQAARIAASLIEHAPTEPAEPHPYLKRKGITGLECYYAADEHGPYLAVPMIDLGTGEPKSIQRIYHDGRKAFLPGTPLKNNALCCPVGARLSEIDPEAGEVWLAEGYATGETVHQATGRPVLIAFDSGNLERVAKAAVERWPGIRLAIAADNDQWKVGQPVDPAKPDGKKKVNTGVEAARKIARTHGVRVVIPDFTNLVDEAECRAAGEGPTDFNDLQALAGIDNVTRQLQPPIRTANDVEDAPNAVDKVPLAQRFTVIEQAGPNKAPGVWYRPPPDKNGQQPPDVWVCAPLGITAATRDIEHDNHGHLLEFRDRHGHAQQWAMPHELLEDRREYRRVLRRLGLVMNGSIEGKDLLQTYLDVTHAETRALCVDRIGWQRDAYVLPDCTLGDAGGERILLQTFDHRSEGYRRAGTLEGWRREIAAYCVGNSRLLLAVGAGFAAPLVALTGDESGGLHFRGDSSQGKTTALKAAATVWGEPGRIERWRATGNALEGVALAHNDNLLCLDELKEVDGREAGQIAYMLANGTGKRRGQPQGGVRQRLTWRLLFLSSGELSLEQHMLEAGKRGHAGQEVRLVDLPADAGAGFGLFDTLHDAADGRALADRLRDAGGRHYGHAGRAFVAALATDRARYTEQVIALRDGFVAQQVPPEASGQVLRVAARFGLIGAAGELATAAGITGWPEGAALEAAARGLADWIDARGGIGSGEVDRALAQVRLFFERYGEARFKPWTTADGETCERCGGSGRVEYSYKAGVCFDCQGTGKIGQDSEPNRPVHDRAGFRRATGDGRTAFYVLPEVFRREIAAGFDAGWLVRVLIDRGLVQPARDGKPQRPERLPGMGVTRVYRFTGAVLGGEDDEEESHETL